MNHGQNTGGGENPNRATGNFKLKDRKSVV